MDDQDLKMAAGLDRAKQLLAQLSELPSEIGPFALMLNCEGRFLVFRVSDFVQMLRDDDCGPRGVDAVEMMAEVEALAPKIVEGTMLVVVEYEPDTWLVARALLDGAVVNAKGGSA